MSKQATGSLFQEFLDPGVYKRSQGKYTRQATFLTLIVLIVLAAWRLSPCPPAVTLISATVAAIVQDFWRGDSLSHAAPIAALIGGAPCR